MPLYEPSMAGTIAQLIARKGDILANQYTSAGDAMARARQLAAQAWQQAIGSIGQTASTALHEERDPKTQLATLQLQAEREKLTDRQAIDEALRQVVAERAKRTARQAQLPAPQATAPATTEPPPLPSRPLGLVPSIGETRTGFFGAPVPPPDQAAQAVPAGQPAAPAPSAAPEPVTRAKRSPLDALGDDFSMEKLIERYELMAEARDRLIREGKTRAAQTLDQEIAQSKKAELEGLVPLFKLAEEHTKQQAMHLRGVRTADDYRRVYQQMPNALKVDLPGPWDVKTDEEARRIAESRMSSEDYYRHMQTLQQQATQVAGNLEKALPHLVSALSAIEKLPEEERGRAWRETYRGFAAFVSPDGTVPTLVPAEYSPANLEIVKAMRAGLQKGDVVPVYNAKGQIVWMPESEAGGMRAAPRPQQPGGGSEGATPAMSGGEIEQMADRMAGMTPQQRADILANLGVKDRTRLVSALVTRGISDIGDRREIAREYERQIAETAGGVQRQPYPVPDLAQSAARRVLALEDRRREALGLKPATIEEKRHLLSQWDLPTSVLETQAATPTPETAPKKSWWEFAKQIVTPSTPPRPAAPTTPAPGSAAPTTPPPPSPKEGMGPTEMPPTPPPPKQPAAGAAAPPTPPPPPKKPAAGAPAAVPTPAIERAMKDVPPGYVVSFVNQLTGQVEMWTKLPDGRLVRRQ
jgi:hypothetical protein